MPLKAWTVKGVSDIASNIEKTLVMDKTTPKVCQEGRGNIGYARVLIQINTKKEIKDTVEICYKNK